MAAPKKPESTKSTKSAPKATVKKVEKKVNYSAMSIADLNKALVEKHGDLLASKSSLKGGELVNPRVLGTTRKEIARIHTAIRAAEAASKESK